MQYLASWMFSNNSCHVLWCLTLQVFNFYPPDYSPDGRIAQAGLYSPESLLLTTPWNVGYLNGMNALINYGLHDDSNGFGDGMSEAEGKVQGTLTFKPAQPNVPTAAVNELATLLTGGRLSDNTRSTITSAYEKKLQEMVGDVDMSNMDVTQNNGKNAVGTYGAHGATDGWKGPQFHGSFGKSCFQTSGTIDSPPWWQVDFGKKMIVLDVWLHPRGWGNTDFVHGMTITVDGVVCAKNITTIGIARSSEKPITCNLAGNVLRLTKTDGTNKQGQKTISLCEVTITSKRSPIPDSSPPAYEPTPATEAVALKHALKLFTVAPEFHATNNYAPSATVRKAAAPIESQERPFKSVVTIFMQGGMDSFNVVVPHSQCTKPKEGGADGEREAFDLYKEYSNVRGPSLAIPHATLMPITVDGAKQPCKVFGINPRMQILHALYEAGDLAIVANMGSLVEPLTREEFAGIRTNGKREPQGNFGHLGMYANLETVEADDTTAEGILGKMVKTVMTKTDEKPMKASLYSLAGDAKMVSGAPMRATHLDSLGVVQIRDLSAIKNDVLNITAYKGSSYFAEHWAGTIDSTIATTEDLGDKMAPELKTAFGAKKYSEMSRQLEQVAKAIRLDVNLAKVERAAYHTTKFGWDSHGTINYDTIFKDMNDGIEDFVADIKQQGLWNNVTIVLISEFGRTLTSNSVGTDHGWGGHYFVMGGAVRGKQMLGKFPNRLDALHSEEDAGRGRFIPTTPFESMWNGVAEWWGINEHERTKIMPLMRNFPNKTMLTKEQLFEV
jgi:uncharacterized protein (DUF1501 family)